MAYTKQITIIQDDPVLSEVTAIIQGNAVLAGNETYLEILRRMQAGEWFAVIPMLKLLQAQYPESRELELLLNEVSLRAEYDTAWEGKIKARRTTINLPRLSSRVVPVLLVVILAVGGIFYYGQNKQVRALTEARNVTLEQAQLALLENRFQEALDHYGEILAEEPSHAQAMSGQQEVLWMLELDEEYNEIKTEIDSGSLKVALEKLIAFQEKSPGFRDVPTLIDELSSFAEVQDVYAAAQAAFDQNSWAEAATSYEAVRLIDSTYESETVTDNLVHSYVELGLAAVTKAPNEETDLQLAKTRFEKALKLQLGEPTAKMERELLSTYLSGENQLTTGQLRRGIDKLLPLYETRPDYLGGHLAQQLYEAYIELGQEAEAEGDLRIAMGFYGKAAALRVQTRTVALEHLRAVALALTPTATPTPIPTVGPTPTPVPLPLASYPGWILFRSNRFGGSELFIMRPDGSDVQLAPYDAIEKFEELYEQEAWSPDGHSRLFVQKQKEASGASFNIFKERVDLPVTWNRIFRMTDMNGTSYDPVWSPNNELVAFVSNVSGGDEIWIMHPDGKDHKQLTWNDWPWDKHPTWSPDGSKIMFWSNRTGLRQIWIMNPDGSDQTQLTTEYENWDPIWLK